MQAAINTTKELKVGESFLARVRDSAPSDLQMSQEIMVVITAVKKAEITIRDGQSYQCFDYRWRPLFSGELPYTEFGPWSVDFWD